ncbi:MAG TPA: helix-turn-helix transcriptional regulator [Candidatus Dormibacteraeota bacterium]|nr:helix-turn-helix transcriptional regulator [Candidatus Dormibacteraeota bacterium]
MDDQQIGITLRSIRIRQGKTQKDVAAIAHVSRFVVGRIERGRLVAIPLGKVRAVATALDARLDLVTRWRGGDLGRLVNARHSAMHDSAARMFRLLAGWEMEPEVSFSIYGERGVIDILAWHPARRSLLVIELKTELVDLNDLMGSVDRKRRLAGDIARDRGWHPASISTWVAIADGRTNRRAVTAHTATLRTKFPTDGAGVRRWLREPQGRIDGLGFLPYVPGTLTRQDLAPIRRVRRRSRQPNRAQPPTSDGRNGLDLGMRCA